MTARVLLTKEEGLNHHTPAHVVSGSRKESPKGREYRLQGRIACWLHRALPSGSGVWWCSLDNGFTSSKSAFFRKLRGCKPGVPDMLFVKEGRCLWIELKASKDSRPGCNQRAVGKALKVAGCPPVAICRSGAEVEAMLREWGFPLARSFHGGYPIPDEWKSRKSKPHDGAEAEAWRANRARMRAAHASLSKARRLPSPEAVRRTIERTQARLARSGVAKRG